MYITASHIISPIGQVENNEKNQVFIALEPDYTSLIPPNLLRRMGKAVRIGMGAALPILKEKPVDAIIIGTANGGLEDCIKFLNQIVDYEEGMLTPTNFVQSTPNALAGQLALVTQNNGYNNTHTNGSLSFENALLDALLLFEENEIESALLGSVEEISSYNYNLDTLSGCFKTENIELDQLLHSTTHGSICGEGANFFRVEKETTEYSAKIVDVEMITTTEDSAIEACLNRLLIKNNIKLDEVDVIISGRSGDGRFDHYYQLLEEKIPTAEVFCYKHLVGEYRTSSGFATWLGCQVLGNENWDSTPYLWRNSAVNSQKKTVLVYSQFMGEKHGFIVLTK